MCCRFVANRCRIFRVSFEFVCASGKRFANFFLANCFSKFTASSDFVCRLMSGKLFSAKLQYNKQPKKIKCTCKKKKLIMNSNNQFVFVINNMLNYFIGCLNMFELNREAVFKKSKIGISTCL